MQKNEGFKLIWKLFKKDGSKDFYKTVIFSKFSKYFIMELTQGKSY